jgi:chromosomal replication initiator protein
LIANATLAQREITVSLAEKITEKIVGEQKSEVTIDMVQKVVCDYFNITRDELLSKTRKRQIVQARQISMYMIQETATFRQARKRSNQVTS